MYNIFNTEQEAIDAQEIDFNMYILNHQDPQAYASQTTAWAIPLQRLDGKWVYPVCDEGIQTHAQEEYSQDWFGTGGEI